HQHSKPSSPFCTPSTEKHQAKVELSALFSIISLYLTNMSRMSSD
ncbi:hypothetical protein TGAM01_v208409, partial [Trichoderma gamsii]